MPRKIRELKVQIAREGFVYLPKRGKGSHVCYRKTGTRNISQEWVSQHFPQTECAVVAIAQRDGGRFPYISTTWKIDSGHLLKIRDSILFVSLS
jgi:hypothetical protein